MKIEKRLRGKKLVEELGGLRAPRGQAFSYESAVRELEEDRLLLCSS